MDYGQYRRARKLVHECCNYDNGQCIALDEGDGCVCVQSISYSVLCHQTIATFTRHQIGTVERALKFFIEFGFVEVLTDGAYYMADIQLLIGQSSTEGERKKKERMRLKR